MKHIDVELLAADGFRLQGTVFEPERSNGVALQINSAANTPRQYYAAFSTHLASLGFTVLNFDVRGATWTGPVRASPSSVLAWGEQDQVAASRFLRTSYPGLAFAILGHSIGGQVLGLSPLVPEARAVLLVASGHGYWRKLPDAVARWKRGLLVLVVGPPVVAALGYMPRFVLGGREKPLTIARELLRFCRSPHFLCDTDGRPLRPYNAGVRSPIRHLVIADDTVVPPGSELDAAELFPNAESQRLLLTPGQYDCPSIGHFGLFRRTMPVAAWNDMADWIESSALGRISGAAASRAVPA